jgi:ubiquinol-cytochrome c reductase cytochrome b subunit
VSKILDWLDDRTSYRKVVRSALDEHVPGGARWAYVWGSALTLAFGLQAVTGVVLMMAYQPSATTAWSSVAYIQSGMSGGWLVRGLHHYGAQAMVVLLACHLGQTALYGAYKKPREMNWLLGLGLMGLTLGFALTGYLLPWDQKGYWATKVATNIAGTIPVIGAFTQRLLVGGAEYGHATLTRFYALHVAVLPAGLVLLLVLHVALFRKHGVTPPRNADKSRVDLFYPKQVWKDLVVGLAVLGIVYFLAVRTHGADLDAPADAASDYPARPEWYFLALFELLKHVPGSIEWVAAVGVPLVLGGYLVLLPFLDRKPDATLKSRAPLLAPLLLILAGTGVLTWMSMRADAADAGFQKARALAQKRAERAAELAKSGVPPEGPLAMLAADPEMRGPELFTQHCTACHRLRLAGESGELAPPEDKDTAPDLSGYGTRAWVLAVLEDPDHPKLFGPTPFKGMMPSVVKPPADPEQAAEFSPMKKEDMGSIADFLASEATGKPQKGLPGEKLVKTRCTVCHRLDGATDDEESLAPELRGWASEAWIAEQIRNPGGGKTYPKGVLAPDLKGKMPAFEEKLTSGEIALLARWVHEQASKQTR